MLCWPPGSSRGWQGCSGPRTALYLETCLPPGRDKGSPSLSLPGAARPSQGHHRHDDMSQQNEPPVGEGNQSVSWDVALRLGVQGWGDAGGGAPEPVPTTYIQVQHASGFIHSFTHSFLSTCSQLAAGETRDMVTVLVPRERTGSWVSEEQQRC